MMYKQHLPFYIVKFKDYPWERYESPYYIFNVEKGSLAEKDIEVIKARQESAFNKIVSTLALKDTERKITYYFYPTQEKKAELMGDGWYGQSIYNEFAVHAVYNEEHKVVGEHEDTHLLSLPLGLPISVIQEGLAEYMTGESMFGHKHTAVVQEGIQRGLPFDIKNLMSQQGWLDTPDEEAEYYYSLAGSLCRYLIDVVGVEKFKKLYALLKRENSAVQNVEILESVIGMTVGDITESLLASIHGN